MSDQIKKIRTVEIVNPPSKLKSEKVRIALVSILSWNLPFYWIARTAKYYKWANRARRREVIQYLPWVILVLMIVVIGWFRLAIYHNGIEWNAIFFILVGIVFNLLMNTFALFKLNIPNRTQMILQDLPRLSYFDVADSAPSKLVLGAYDTKYVTLDWFSPLNQKHLMIYGDTDGTGARDYLLYLAWCASIYPKTVLVFCDSGHGSGYDFPAAYLQSDEVTILNTSTQINKFFSWLNGEFKERFQSRRLSKKNADVRIVVFLDDETSDVLFFKKRDNPTLAPIAGYADDIVVDGKSNNIHFIALAPAFRRPVELSAKYSVHFEPITFYYRVRFRTKKGQGMGPIWEVEESPSAKIGDTYIGKKLDVAAIHKNGWQHFRAPVISAETAGIEISKRLKTNDPKTLELRIAAEDFESLEVKRIETFNSRYEVNPTGGLRRVK